MEAKQETCDKRASVRVSASAVVTIDESEYQTNNWSIGGFQISDFRQKVEMGDCLPVQFNLTCYKGIHISIDTLVEVAWLSSRKGKLGACFLNLTKFEKDFLQQIINSLIAGELPLAEAIQEVDKPGSLLLKNSEPNQTTPSLNNRRQKFWLSILLYIIVGISLGLATLRSLYRSVSYMEIKSAVLNQPFEPIVSTHQGRLSQLYVREGMEVQSGQPLFRISNDDATNREIGEIDALIRDKIQNIDRLTQEVELSRIEVMKAKSERHKAESMRQQELTKLATYKAIAQSQLDSARIKVESLEIQRQTVQKNRDRAADLLEAGAVSQQMYDSVNAKLVDVDASLKVAREELRIARIAVFSLQAGNFFDGNGILGELNDRTINVRDAEKQAQIAEQKVGALKQALQKQKQDLQTLRQQRQNLVTPPSESATKETSLSVVYKAPVSGKVLQIEKLAGNTVNRGEKLIVLRYEFEQPIIDAYLTQDQAAQIVVGSQATVLLPALGKLYQAQVVEIDLTGGFVSEVRGQYQFQGSQERSVYVRLALVAIAPADKKQLPAGMPVELRIAKRTNIATTLFSH